MHPRANVPSPLLRLAACQDGVVSREQVLAHGLSADVLGRLIRDGAWQRLGRGVYLTNPVAPSWSALAWAGVLVGGDAARLGPQASGHLHGMVTEPPHPIDVLVPFGRPVRVSGPWIFQQERAGVRSPRSVGHPARLTGVDTLLDLVGRSSQSEVVDLVTRAVRQRVVSAPALLTALEARGAQRHRTFLRQLLADVGEGVESPLELTYLRDVERAHGLPRGHRQRYRGGLRYRTDVGYDEWALLVELDGRLGHEGADRFRDFRRDNAFAFRSMLTLRYGWFDVVERPCLVAQQVARVLISRGWAGPASSCRRCRHADLSHRVDAFVVTTP